MRLFIAFPISQEVKNELESAFVSLRQTTADRLKWTSEDGWHITVAFLGDIDVVETQCIASLREVIETVCKKYRPMNFRLDKIDGFPNIENPNVIVAKAIDESGMASQLQKELVDKLRKIGIEIENRLWKPHITIARNKMGERVTGLDKVKIEPIRWKVNEVILFESELWPSGPARHASQLAGVAGRPRYTKIYSCNL